MTFLQSLKISLEISAVFMMLSAGALLLQLRSESIKVTASLQSTLSKTQVVLNHLDEDVTTANSVLRTANGAINNARDILRDEKASIKEANDQTIETMDNLDKLVQSLDVSQKEIATNVADTLKTIQATTASVAPVMNQAQRDLADLEPVIEQTRVTMQNTADTMAHVSGVTADVQAEVHKLVYPPPQKWYQKYILSPMKIGLKLFTIPIK